MEIALQEIDLDASMDEFFAAMQQPSIDGFNTFLVARAARQAGVRVALSGVGGDELFGGYPSFADVPRLARVLGLIGPAAPLSGSLVSHWPSTRAAKLGAILSAAPKSPAD